MGDMANMTDCDGRVSGDRLLRWLKTHLDAEEWCLENNTHSGDFVGRAWHKARADLLREMADDLEQELTPPDYPEDNGDTVDLDDPALTVDPDERNQS